MKRLLFIFSVLACVLASCQKEMPSINGTKVTVSVGTDLTKTVLGENNGTTWPVLWQNAPNEACDLQENRVEYWRGHESPS